MGLWLAGSSRAVREFCSAIERNLASIGLTPQRMKCEIVPPARDRHTVPAQTFDGFKFNSSGDFKLLGAPFGSTDFCTEHTRKRKQKAQELLDKLSALHDPQAALLLLRHCASFCKLSNSIRAVPPSLHRAALQEFSSDIHSALDQIVGAEVDDRGWGQAKLGIKAGGLGLRGIDEHASAAFVASLGSVKDFCITPSFDTLDSNRHLLLQEAKEDLYARVLPDAVLELDDVTYRQKRYSGLFDAKSRHDLTQHPNADASFQAHLALQGLPGAGAWLTAPPSDDAREVDPILFRIAVKRRLRLRVQICDSFCPMCGSTMDSFGDHALVCQCNGDRTLRHNALRNCVHADAVRGNMSPEREKAGFVASAPGWLPPSRCLPSERHTRWVDGS